MYDFANSAFYTTIMSAVFPVYFAEFVIGDKLRGERLWGYTTSVAFLLVLLTAPILGAICDFAGRKKRLTALFWILGCGATAALAIPGPGQGFLAAGLIIAAVFSWQTTVQLTNAYLPELATPTQTNRVSGFAWAVGYVGGGSCLGLNLWMISRGEALGAQSEWTRYVFLSVAAWWFVFAFPFFLGVRDRAVPKPPDGGYLGAGIRQSIRTLRSIRANRELYKFLFAFMLINGGLVTVLTQAALFGRNNLDMTPKELVLVMLMVQIVAAPGALGYGVLADRIGTKRTLYSLLVLWVAMCVWAFFMQRKGEYWGLAAIVALVMGGTQSVCRAAIAQMSPTEQTAEFYGFFSVAGRLSEVVGTFVYPTAILLLQTPRAGILSVAIFFVAGAVMLSRVREPSSLKPSS